MPEYFLAFMCANKFKGELVWNEYQIPVKEVLALTPVKPLIGHRSGKQSKTHWLVFMKL